MKRKIEERLFAIKLREKGYSVNEIVKEVKVAKSSVSAWVRNVTLTQKARARLLTKIKIGQLVSAENKRKRAQETLEKYFSAATEEISRKDIDEIYKKIMCALLYWCEGIKNHSQGVCFINSDADLIKTFLSLLRDGFQLKEKKFRACIHLHEYHNSRRQTAYWSKLTGIPKTQFIKPYLKPHTGKRVRKDYPGCISIRYFDSDLAKQLISTARAFFKIYGRVG